MTRKDKVKELVGRGLNSYHTKALQQVDRIEKKNKEQNHKISILSNELDNDYLTKTEEGSVVSLEHSKEGMVYLDELQGNTMVNYCTDGSKEMILNGDIDVEGAFITTTEGVDDGKVDVMCEGNTLVNLATIKSVTLSNTGSKVISNLTFKQDTKYTLIFDVDSNSVTNESHKGIYLWFTADGITSSNVSALDLKGRKKYVMTRSDKVNGWGIGCRNDLSGTVILNNILILEGDWSNKELPTYFEGMKSVGQDDENGHKIEILSRNKNLFDGIWYSGSIDYDTGKETNSSLECRTDYIDIEGFNSLYKKEITDVTIPYEHYKVRLYDKNKNYIGRATSWMVSSNTYTIGDNVKYLRLIPYSTSLSKMENIKLIISKENISEETYIIPKLNKKEISLNKPLRGLPNGIKDRFVKIGGKWFAERNCGEYTLTEFSEGVTHNAGVPNQNDTMVFSVDRVSNNLNYKQSVRNGVCDKFSNNTDVEADKEFIYFGQNINIRINKTKLTSQNTEGFKQWLKNNPIKIVYQLETPIYEPLEIEPILNTYLDTTHISNNSIIPCNMKIKNSGYNAIIKPSTLYTVALDTNKSGTIGMNLGGAKGTTNNNVLTLTTPATLSDDSLRLYGKGIKGSKLRLLEGDKTNWIPSHFEGMQSSFEDKLQNNGSYKMEILSNNENLFDDSQFEGIRTVNINGHECYDYRDIKGLDIKLKKPFIVKKGHKYYLTCRVIRKYSEGTNLEAKQYIGFSFEPNGGGYGHPDAIFFVGGNGSNQNAVYQDTVVATPKNNITLTDLSIVNYGDIDNRCIYLVKDSLMLKSENFMQIYTPHKSNKIQFSSIEPLRKWDRFVFKDGQLMIERGSKKIILNNERTWGHSTTRDNLIEFYTHGINEPNGLIPCMCDKFSSYDVSYLEKVVISGNTAYVQLHSSRLTTQNVDGFKQWLTENPLTVVYKSAEPTYEEIPYELQKIILEGYENGTLFLDTNIPPTATITYAGETPVASTIKDNKIDISKNTDDINENIIPYLMEMDYRVAVLHLQSENISGTMNVSRVFGGVKEMLIRDIKSKRYSAQEYLNRISIYHAANKITIEEMEEIKSVIMEVYNG